VPVSRVAAKLLATEESSDGPIPDATATTLAPLTCCSGTHAEVEALASADPTLSPGTPNDNNEVGKM
jgi:hypothetical protein